MSWCWMCVQMGEQLMCKVNPTSDLVKKRLAQLRDQWSTLKQTTANQIKAMGGAKSLQEFNVKVDRLEAWIKEKVKKRCLKVFVQTVWKLFAVILKG